MNRIPSALLTLMLLSCTDAEQAPCPPFHIADAGVCVLDEAAVADQMRHFDDGDLVQVNAHEFDQVMGEATARNVYMNRLELTEDVEPQDTIELYRHADPRTAGEVLPAAFPVGTLIVHERVDRFEGSTVQVRLADYENAGGGPWWFGKYFEDGTPDDAPCSPCEMCHEMGMNEGTEGLQGVPEDAWIDLD